MEHTAFISASPLTINVSCSKPLCAKSFLPDFNLAQHPLSAHGRYHGYQPIKMGVPNAPKSPEIQQDLQVLKYKTKPFEGQKTGTSGMRKKTSILLSEPAFLPNWIQSLFNALGAPMATKGATLVLGGDGRFYNSVAAQTIIRMAAANGYSRVVVGRGALLTTPAVSRLIPLRKAAGGIILTASHNPAGPNGDWGVKYNTDSGAPALTELTDAIYEQTVNISEYLLADFGSDVDLSAVGETSFSGGKFTVEVIDPVDHYIDMLNEIFDFDAIRQLVERPDFSFVFDSMHASTGEYATRLFEKVLGAAKGTVINGIPLPDFGGGHPDPNQTYAAELVKLLDPKQTENAPQFGAASDGDGDRNMILGKGVFVSPADSLAIIADYAQKAIPYFGRRGVCGVARSMPTSNAIDLVADSLDVPCYETPTGWKFFTNLMDDGKINICGEESFGTGSDHIREKDGLWAVTAWLSILAYVNRDSQVGELVTVEDILLSHWRKYGRTYNLRYDYEQVDLDGAELFMTNLCGMAADIVPKASEEVERMEEFEYKDPVDRSLTEGQGVILRHVNGGRVVFRLSGTGSSDATIRMYFEIYEAPLENIAYKDAAEKLKDLVDFTVEFSRVEDFTDRTEPTVIT